MLDLPTNEAWIDPWMRHLKSLGVQFVRGQGLERYELKGGRIRAAWLRNGAGKRTRVEADWYVNAMPVEQVTKTFSPSCCGADPSLRRLRQLFPDWMVGIQYFLRKPVEPPRATSRSSTRRGP